MKTETYKVGCDGNIDDTVVFATSHEAIAHAMTLYDKGEFEDKVAVYGECEYSEDDKTPLYARTEFWRHWYITMWGKVSQDGR